MKVRVLLTPLVLGHAAFSAARGDAIRLTEIQQQQDVGGTSCACFWTRVVPFSRRR